MLDKKLIKNAALEAIFWWNRDEYYYNYYFSKLDNIFSDKKLLEFFTGKIFEIFLRDYSIRRNISAGYQKVDDYLMELLELNFVQRVKNGETNAIDEVSDEIQQRNESTNNQTRSLLSKMAFLINPNVFSLYDTLAKASLWNMYKVEKKCKLKDLEYYSNFLFYTNELIEDNSILLRTQFKTLNSFKSTEAFKFFSINQDAFYRRIMDKYLWLKEQSKEGRILTNDVYIKFIKL